MSTSLHCSEQKLCIQCLGPLQFGYNRREIDMPGNLKVAFDPGLVVLPISSILPSRTVPERIKKSSKYKLIANSIEKVGIIEPPVVARVKGHKDEYLLLDGHLRVNIIAEQNAKEVLCLIANDDEAYTY